MLRRFNNFTVRMVRQGPEYQTPQNELQQGGKPQAYLSPGEEFHLFVLDGKLIWMRREVQIGGTMMMEKIRLATFCRSKEPLEAFIHADLQARISRELNKIAIYIPSPYTNEWMRARLGNNRKIASVILKQGQKETVVADLKQFFASKQRYEELGIPWRRGYLLFGTPSTGKTSLVTALASDQSLNVCTLSLASPNITDERIGNVVASVPARSVILLEDIDSFFNQRQKADAQVKLSFSGFINVLGGVAAHEGSVVFLTTNHPDLIVDAAIRSGRVDVRMELSNCDSYQLEQMFLKFFPDANAAKNFAATITSGEFSPATIQERLLKAKNVDDAFAAFPGKLNSASD